MQAYASTAPPTLARRLRRRQEVGSPATPPTVAAAELGALDGLLGRLADLVADRVIGMLTAAGGPQEEWLDARGAAEYLGVHRDTLRKLAAERSVPTHQERPGCKLYFRRRELDAWRRSSPAGRASARSLRAVS